jgi:hypothetical protein
MDIGTLAGAFVERPFLALIPAAVFGWLYIRRRKWMILIAALAWLAYFPYEHTMKTACSSQPDQCDIRVDLLPIYFVLFLLSVLAIIAYVRASRSARQISQ